MHSSISWHGAGLRVYAVAGDHSGDVRCRRCRDERALSAFERATRLAAVPAKIRSVDAASETIHGLSATGHAALSPLRARRPARCRGHNLGQLFSARNQCRVLDERRVRCSNRIGCQAAARTCAHARARVREWHLFHRRQVSVYGIRFRRFTTSRRLAAVHARSVANRTGARPHGVCRFYSRVVPHVQIQRSQRA